MKKRIKKEDKGKKGKKKVEEKTEEENKKILEERITSFIATLLLVGSLGGLAFLIRFIILLVRNDPGG